MRESGDRLSTGEKALAVAIALAVFLAVVGFHLAERAIEHYLAKWIWLR